MSALATISLQSHVERYGAYAAAAAVLGLGVLSLLYLAQARELQRLREWAGRAPNPAVGVAADPQARVTPPPAAEQLAAPTGAAATIATRHPATTAPPEGSGAGVPSPVMPGPGRPSLAEAAGRPSLAEAPTPDTTPAGRSETGDARKPSRPEAMPPVPAPEPAGRTGRASQTRPRAAGPPHAPATSSLLAPRTPAVGRARFAGDGDRSRGRVVAIVGSVLAGIAVVCVAGVLLFGGDENKQPPKANAVATPTERASAAVKAPSEGPGKVKREAVQLAVLNGTTVTGLAHRAADRLAAEGYSNPKVVSTDTTNQAREASEVFYEAGSGPRRWTWPRSSACSPRR